MKTDEAKFLLRAYRPNGRDAADPLFAEPLAEVQHDPELSAWLQSEQAFDDTIFNKLQELNPPPDLEASIIAGVRASQQRRRPWWTKPMWLAIAATIAVIVTGLASVRFVEASKPGMDDFAIMAMNDLANSHAQHQAHPPGLDSVLAQFASAPLPLPAHLSVDLEQLRRQHCRTANFGGRQVYEICFKREGVWFHLYAARLDDFRGARDATNATSAFLAKDKLASTTWRDGRNVYALVTRDDQLRAVL